MRLFPICVATMLLGGLVCIPAIASPNQMAYQGVLTGSNGLAVSGSVSATFKLYSVSSGGTALWTQSKTLNVNRGHFTTTLDNLNATYFPSTEDRYLGITIGSDVEMQPRVQLLGVPVAYYAETADSLEIAPYHLANSTGVNQHALKTTYDDLIGIGYNGISPKYSFDVAGSVRVTGAISAYLHTITLSSDDNSATLPMLQYRAIQINMAAGMSHTLAISFVDPPGPCDIKVIFLNPSFGGYGITWPLNVKWSRSVSLSTFAEAYAIVNLRYDGVYYYATYQTASGAPLSRLIFRPITLSSDDNSATYQTASGAPF